MTGSCNTVQNEIGGKELLLKACQDRIGSTVIGVAATLTLQGIVLTAKIKGVLGNSIRLALIDPNANSAVLSVVVTGQLITVNLATDGTGDITSDADDVIAAIIASVPASALVTATGSGVIALTAAASTPLAGGIDSVLNLTLPVVAKKGDIVRFNTIGALTTVEAKKFYAVIEVLSSTSLRLSPLLNGAPLDFDVAASGLEIDVFSTLGGLRSKSFGFASEAVDITNGDSDEWKTILDQAGQRSFSVSGSGVYTNEEIFQKAQADAIANLLTCLMFIEVKTGRIYNGCFKITSLEISGDYNAESAYSLSAESSGKIEIVKME